ncbi:hypothetical protein FA419_07825 [Pseudomonas aeruginosa]|nr:hypothetical protein [Pseudomonas aeruginosa]MCO2020207.1 hypothetical protein [Pseudomonas aeruginosa]MCO3814979.1 hypothetical protein [Pseudomonas aeruginosa]MCO3827044.1 hypothetical protein [Pseudomonas aeruginosa]MCO3832568.1 hypothetical protein [Pseudomonas aeruginosa]
MFREFAHGRSGSGHGKARRLSDTRSIIAIDRSASDCSTVGTTHHPPGVMSGTHRRVLGTPLPLRQGRPSFPRVPRDRCT